VAFEVVKLACTPEAKGRTRSVLPRRERNEPLWLAGPLLFTVVLSSNFVATVKPSD